jgi:hypothetical protein
MKLSASALLVPSALLLASATARADDARAACVSAYEEGQVQRKEGKLLEARSRLLVCAQAACSPVLRNQCTAWLAELDQAVPTAVLVARGPHGEDLVDVRVSLDGNELTTHLDGKAIGVNPGSHVFRFEIEGAVREVNLLAVQGEHERRVVADFRADTESPPAEQPRRVSRPVPGIVPVLGATSLVSFGVFASFGLMGLSGKSDLDARQCKPACPQADVDDVRRRFLVADIGLGVGVASLAIAGIAFFTRGEQPAADQATGVALDATPVNGGGALRLRGSF